MDAEKLPDDKRDCLLIPQNEPYPDIDDWKVFQVGGEFYGFKIHPVTWDVDFNRLAVYERGKMIKIRSRILRDLFFDRYLNDMRRVVRQDERD